MIAMGIADAHLAEVGAPCDEWDREGAVKIMQSLSDADPVLRDAELLYWAAHPVVRLMIDVMLDRSPAIDVSEAAELTAAAALSRRQIAVFRAAGIDGGMAVLNLAILDWVDAQAEVQDGPEYALLVRERIDGLLDAGRRGRERGRRLRQSSEARRLPKSSFSAVVELEVLAPVGHGWTEPVATTVVASQTPSVSVGDRLGLRLIPDPEATSFNGTLVSVRGGERWLTCAHRLQDGTIVPEDGTRRIAA
ncbi:MAG: hypothetical protein WAL22_12215 [Solirubrobacteraceae bacterium]